MLDLLVAKVVLDRPVSWPSLASLKPQAADSWNENTAVYLIVHPLLPDYLAEGLDQHGYSCD